MSGKITWLIIVIFLFNDNVVISQIEYDENLDSLFNVNSATIDALFSSFEDKSSSNQHKNNNEEVKKLTTTTINNISNNKIICEEINLSTTFIRYSNLISKRKTFYDGNIDLLSCTDYCKKNIIPLSSEKKVCAGLNYFKNENGGNTCQLVDKFQIGDLEKSEEDDNMNHWYQKVCLNIKNHCENKLILFDGIPNYKIKNGNIIKEIKCNIENCFELCISIDNCYGINFIKNNTCQLIAFNNFEKKEEIERDANFNFFRNECVKKKCLLNSQSFLFYPYTRIQSPKILTSSTSLDECMKECTYNNIVNCESLQFSRNKNECNIYNFSVLKTIPSQYIDIYKPVCFNIPLNRNCKKQFIYKVNEKTSVKEEIKLLYFKNDINVNNCLQECLNNEKCYSMTFQKISNKCNFYGILLNSTNFKNEEDVDLYILNCDYKINTEKIEKDFISTSEPTIELFPTPTATLNNFELSSITSADNPLIDNLKINNDTTKKNCSLIPLLKLVQKGKILRQEFRIIHQKNTINVTHCSILCKNSKINCTLIAYSTIDKYCFLSNYLSNDYNSVIQENDRYDVWSLIKNNNCLQNNIDDKAFGNVIDRTPKIFNKNNDSNFTIVNNERNKVTPKYFDISESTTIKLTSNPKTTPLSTPYTTVMTTKTTKLSSTTIKLNNNINENLKTKIETRNSSSNDNKKILVTKNTINYNNENYQIPKNENLFTQVMPSDLKVHVACYPTGVNVTFNVLSKNYTGVVYATERFSYCKTIVNYLNTFSLFIPRPRFNNSCNSIEINRQLTAILVMSNDLVIPYDLTTKDDLIYEIKCDYNDKEMEDKIINGSAKSQNELIIKGDKDDKTNINLKVMRGDKPVEHAFIGEKLKLVLLSNSQINNLNVISCNASKVEEVNSEVKSISLISNECSLVPQVISNIDIGKYGFEANLTLFKFDGSDYIDILCNVLICHNNCQKKLSCNGSLNNTIYEEDIIKKANNLSIIKTVKKRIHILVDEEFPSLFDYQLFKQYEDSPITKNNTSSSSFFYNLFNDNQCIDIHIFGVSITIFLTVIIILISIISCSRKVERKKYGVVAYNTN